MKHLQQNLIRNFLTLSLFLLPALSWGKPVVRIISVKGNVFLMTEQGTSELVKKEQHIEDFSDLMVEDGAEVSFTDSYEHIYHLSGGTQVKILDRVVELRNGSMWLQNGYSTSQVQVQTSNAVGEFDKGEFIISYAADTSKTTLLVLNGEAKFYNSAEENLYQNISSTQFSFIDPAYDNGAPRMPTIIGYDSFHQVVSLFTVKPQTAGIEKFYAGSDPQPKNTDNKREIASVTEGSNVVLKKTIFIPAKKSGTRSVASIPPVTGEALHYYKKMQKPKVAWKGESAPVVVFGNKQLPQLPAITTPVVVRRELASQKPISSITAEAKPSPVDPAFMQSLQNSYKQQERHPAEVNRLIDELESYSTDFHKKY